MMVGLMKLVPNMYVPTDMLLASQNELKKANFNKCGPDGALNRLIPNHLLGVEVSASCNIHDWTYQNASSKTGHKNSDLVFLHNMQTQIRAEGGALPIRILRHGLAYMYFGAARLYSFFSEWRFGKAKKKRPKRGPE